MSLTPVWGRKVFWEMGKLFGKISLRRFLVMAAGIVLLSLGIALFKLSLMGNDPSSAMVMAVGDAVGLGFAPMLFIMNCLWFVSEFFFGRRLIGVGTFVNWFGVGTIASAFVRLISGCFTLPTEFFPRLLVMLCGVLVLSLACSMYQTADLGIAPYDALSLVLSEKLKKVPYFWCRIFTDAVCTLIAFVFGGIVGIGTLVCALGLGPFISFFDRHISRRLCGVDK